MSIYRKSIGRQPAVLATKERSSRPSLPAVSPDLVQLAFSVPAHSTPEAILQAQRLVGNRAMDRLINPITQPPGSLAPIQPISKPVSDLSQGAPFAIQAKWIDDDTKKDRQKWDSVQNGIQWYKEGSNYSYEIVDQEKILPNALENAQEFVGTSFPIEAWQFIGLVPPVEEEKKEEIEQVKQELEETKQEEKISQIEWVYEHDREFLLKVIEICKEGGVGGLCTAWVIDWWQKKQVGKEPSKRYTDEELKELVKKQLEYYKAQNLIAYGKKEGFDLNQVGYGKIGYSGGFGNIKEVILEDGTGYLLDLEPNDYSGINIGHSIALFKEKDGLTFMDQNHGQGRVTDLEAYVSEMESYFAELYKEEEFRWWSLYKLIPQNIK